MVGTRRQVELRHCRPHQTQTLLLQLAVFSHFSHTHIGIAKNSAPIGAREPGALNIPCRLHARADEFGFFPHSIPAQLLIIHARDLDVNIDVVEQWPCMD
jgi:hypothetical protein